MMLKALRAKLAGLSGAVGRGVMASCLGLLVLPQSAEAFGTPVRNGDVNTQIGSCRLTVKLDSFIDFSTYTEVTGYQLYLQSSSSDLLALLVAYDNDRIGTTVPTAGRIESTCGVTNVGNLSAVTPVPSLSYAQQSLMSLSFSFTDPADGLRYDLSARVEGATTTRYGGIKVLGDNTDPTVTIADFTGPLNGPQSAQITLSEDATDFVVSDLTITNGTATLSGSGTSYTAVLTPTADGAVALSIAAATFTDAAGNGNTASNSVTTTFDGTVPTVTIATSADTYQGTTPFTVSVTFTEPVVGFEVTDLSVTNGVASGFSGTGTVFTATITPTGNGNVTISVPESVAFDVAGNPNSASAPLTVTGTTVAVTQERIANFMMSRATALLANQPDLSGQLGAAGGRFDVAVRKDHSTFDMATRTDGPLWARITGSVAESGASESTYVLGVLGAKMAVNENLLVGAMVQLDYAEEIAGDGMISGTGWLAGPYVVARSASQPLVFESSLLFGRTTNDITPLGTYSDTFETARVLATAKITGNIQSNDITWYPSLGFNYVQDAQAAYTDSLSNVIAKQTIEMTQATVGLDFAKALDAHYTLSGGVTGIYSHSDGTGGQAASLVPFTEGLRARADLGVTFASDSGITSGASVFYDGIGTDDYEAYGVRVSLAIAF